MLELITPPMTPRGRVSRMAMGMGQLSYSAARTRKITKMEKAYRTGPWAVAIRSW